MTDLSPLFFCPFIITPLVISAKGFAFRGATLSLLGLRPAGSQHCRYSPAGVYAFCTNHQLQISLNIGLEIPKNGSLLHQLSMY